jgi:1-deoxy-D-xylulose-5-phosphate reductoisomerase
MRRVALLGATGSIGRQALEVIAVNSGLEACALMSGTTSLDELAAAYRVEHVQVGGDPRRLLEASEPDVVLNAIVGFAGVRATLWALERGVTLALANKESLVAAGELAVAARERGGGALIPVDSEHSALFQGLDGGERDTVQTHNLTASGAPFRGRGRTELAGVTVDEALAHPTWSMGRKITVDSATLANKGLELIEAHWLFGIPYDRIEVVVHPSSVVHALVRFRDGAALAHLGYPDMRVPITFGLTYPKRAPTPVAPLDLASGLVLEFEAPDVDAFPLLPLAREAGQRGGTYPCAYNAANEVAVAAFLEQRIGFLDIAATVEATLARVEGAPASDLADLEEADAEARQIAEGALTPASRSWRDAGKGGRPSGAQDTTRSTDKRRSGGNLPSSVARRAEPGSAWREHAGQERE